MSTQYVAADVPGLARMAFLVDRINKDPESDKSRGLMSELRLQEARFGLSPMDRSRLDWEIGRVDPDKDPTQRPTTKKKATKKKGKPIDPRGFLKAVK